MWIDESNHVVECATDEMGREEYLSLPWGVLWRGDEIGGGQEVWVEATAEFDLILHHGPTTFFEHISTGRHRLVLTVLDRTDVSVNK